MATILAIEHIEIDPQKRGGRPMIKGTGIMVKDIVYDQRVGLSVDYIAEQFGLTPGQIYAALSYYYDHKDEIDADMRRDEDIDPELLRQSEERRQRIKTRMAELDTQRTEAASKGE